MYILHTLYNSLIVSYISYGLPLWRVESHRIEPLQKKAIRLITNSNYSAHTTPPFIELGILKVQDMFKLKLLKFYYKLSYGCCSEGNGTIMQQNIQYSIYTVPVSLF